jgi:hypothetical protein
MGAVWGQGLFGPSPCSLRFWMGVRRCLFGLGCRASLCAWGVGLRVLSCFYIKGYKSKGQAQEPTQNTSQEVTRDRQAAVSHPQQAKPRADKDRDKDLKQREEPSREQQHQQSQPKQAVTNQQVPQPKSACKNAHRPAFLRVALPAAPNLVTLQLQPMTCQLERAQAAGQLSSVSLVP